MKRKELTTKPMCPASEHRKGLRDEKTWSTWRRIGIQLSLIGDCPEEIRICPECLKAIGRKLPKQTTGQTTERKAR